MVRGRLPRILLGVQAAIWGGLAALLLSGRHPAAPEEPLSRTILTGGSLLLTGLFAGLAGMRTMPAWLCSLTALLLGILFLSAWLDQVGWVDAAYMALTLFSALLWWRRCRI